MEFIRKSFIDTTTSIVVNSNTETAINLMLRDERYQYASDGLNVDGTVATIRINFAATQSVSRIALVGHNLKEFRVYYNGVTANTFNLTSTGATTVSYFTTNSETSTYLKAAAVDCTSVSIDMYQTIIANQNKAIGYLAVSNLLSDLDGRVPRAQNYRPLFTPKEVIHELSDGSFRSQVIDRKFSANISLDFVEEAAKNEIKAVFDLHDDFIFAAFPTTTGWDEVIFPCIWKGPFEFHEVTDNAISAGYSGSIRLLETTPG
jgi:hypothetical protein